MSRFNTLVDWLDWMQTLHPIEIDLGLSRVYKVARALNIINPPSDISHTHSGALSSVGATVFTVAGTNGKGTCTATLTACLVAANLRVGTYTSPHFHRYAERICIDGHPVSDTLICDAFSAIDQARGDTSLSYFEFGTLAALWVFVQQQVPYVVLEVGLGGRLDAVNIVDTDVAIITSIDIDHQDWLGSDRESISKEKLGIARLGRPLIIAEDSLTPALSKAADEYIAQVIDRDFFIDTHNSNVPVLVHGLQTIPINTQGLHPNSVSAALVSLTQQKLLPEPKVLSHCLAGLSIPGRCEHAKVKGIEVIFDVAHNPAAVKALKEHLLSSGCDGVTRLVMAIMEDKDYHDVIRLLSDQLSMWFVGDLPRNARALNASVLAQALAAQQQDVSVYDQIHDAFDNALSACEPHDRIVVLGSFFTVAAIKDHIAALNH